MAPCPRCQDGDETADAALCSEHAPTSPSATLARALEAWRDHLPTMLLFWAIPAAASTAARAGVLVRNQEAFQAYADGIQEVFAGADPNLLLEPAATLAPWLAADAAVAMIFFAAMHPIARALARGDDPGPGPGLAVAGRRALPLLATALLVALSVGLGTLLLVVPGLIALHWFVLALPAAGAGAGPVEALQRSRRLVRDHGSPLFLAVAGLVWFGADSLAVGGAELVAGAAGVAPHSLAGVMATGLAQWILAPLVPLYVATYHVHLEAAEHRGPETEAGPEAVQEEVVIGQCPDCGAFVPDDRTRPDVDPSCPTCGYEGQLDAKD